MRGTIGGRGGVVPPPPLENSKSNLDIKSTENMPYKIYSSISLASTIIPRTPPPSLRKKFWIRACNISQIEIDLHVYVLT